MTLRTVVCYWMVAAIVIAPAEGQEEEASTPVELPDIEIISDWNNPLPARRYRSGVEHHTFMSEANDAEVGYSIYLPPDYHLSDNRYPVHYFLGGGGNDENRQQKRWAHYLDPAIDYGALPAMIVVWPNPMKKSWVIDSQRMKVETMIMRELIPHVDATYRTYSDREHRWIGGMSMGGTACLRLALKYPDIFSSVVSYAPAMWRFEGVWDFDHPVDLVEANLDGAKTVSVRIVCGSTDRLYEGARDFSTYLDSQGVASEFETIVDVGHEMNEMFRQVGIKGLLFQFSGLQP